MTLFIANDLKLVCTSQIYHNTQNNAGCRFSEANNYLVLHKLLRDHFYQQHGKRPRVQCRVDFP